MTQRLTATAAARSFSELLSLVQYKGQHFVIVRGGEAVAELVPTTSPVEPVSVQDLLQLLADLPIPDPDFAADLQAAQACQPSTPEDPWAS